MAYQENTTVATPDVLINNLMNFCDDNGWTIERNNLAGSNRTATLRKTGVTDYIHVYNTDATSVRMRISVGYDGGLPPASQPNVSPECRTGLFAGAYPKSFFFASEDQVWAATAIAASGEYRHFTFGRLEKAGAYTGGTYIDGTIWGESNFHATWSNNLWPFSSTTNGGIGYVRADIPDDSKSNYFFRIGGANTAAGAFGEMGESGTGALLSQNADANPFSGRSILHAIPIFAGRTGSQLYFSPLGVVQDVRIVSIQKFAPGQELTIGDDVWKVFPLIAKRAMNGTTGAQPDASGNYGFAIKKVT